MIFCLLKAVTDLLDPSVIFITMFGESPVFGARIGWGKDEQETEVTVGAGTTERLAPDGVT